ncbi:MAG: hypothetical protein ABJB05_00015 [Parafilimonas sp.]
MEKLINKENSKLNAELKRIGDLINDGAPLLSLFQNVNTNSFYLFDFVDFGGTENRWLVYYVPTKELSKFIFGKISHRELLHKIPSENIFYTDIDSSLDTIEYIIQKSENYPAHYLKGNNAFFEEEDAKNLNKIYETLSLSKTPLSPYLEVVMKDENRFIHLHETGHMPVIWQEGLYVNDGEIIRFQTGHRGSPLLTALNVAGTVSVKEGCNYLQVFSKGNYNDFQNNRVPSEERVEVYSR